jgi:hypothetical protein
MTLNEEDLWKRRREQPHPPTPPNPVLASMMSQEAAEDV